MKRVFTIIFAIAIFVACNPNKRIVSTVPIKTDVMGIALCEPTTTSKIEKILIEEDAAISPLYQRGLSFLSKDKVKNLYNHAFGGDYSYKWVSIEE